MSEKDKGNLTAIADAIFKIEQFTSTFADAASFYHDVQAFDATLMNFIVIGESVKRISPELKQSKQHIEWKMIAGFRDIVAHDYFGVDADEIWEIIKTHLPKLKDDLTDVIRTST